MLKKKIGSYVTKIKCFYSCGENFLAWLETANPLFLFFPVNPLTTKTPNSVQQFNAKSGTLVVRGFISN